MPKKRKQAMKTSRKNSQRTKRKQRVGGKPVTIASDNIVLYFGL